MLGAILNSYGLILNEMEELLDGLPAEFSTLQPPGLPNHAVWTLGHLCFSAQAIGEEISLDHWLPPEWTSLFRTGSTPGPDASAYPGLPELRAALGDARDRLSRQLNLVSPDDLAGPLPDLRFRSVFPSTANAILHILVGHTSYHHGQLSLWRSAVRMQHGR